jgi:thioredoxin reductase (NADPH)
LRPNTEGISALPHDYDVIVAGAGIAGLTAALTTARLGRKTMVLAGDVLGGQLLSIEKVEGYPGFPEGVPGYDLCPMAQEQAMTAGAEFSQTNIEGIAPEGDGWKVTTGEGDMTARAIIVATGTALKHLGVPGEEKFTGNGVSHCATCDGPLLKNKVAVVVGGGDSAMQEALTLAQFVSQTIIINKAGELTGQSSYRQLVEENSKIEVRNNSTVEEILGDAAVSAVRVVSGGARTDVPVNGVFVFVGLKPETKFLDGLVTLTAEGGVETDGAMRTKLKGICAAGTVRAGAAGRAAASAGDGSVAAITIDRYLADGVWAV